MLKIFLREKFLIVTFIAILVLGFALRYQDLTIWPRHGATFDEFAWVWLGMNLIQKGEPVSWSPHSQYEERQEIRYQGAAFLIVKPYLEHPPLFGLVAGTFALVNGAQDMYDVTLTKIRPLALFLGLLSIAMIFILVRQLYGISTALVASALYATVPTVVVGSRIVQNENFLIPFWLLSLYFLARYIKTGNRKFRNVAAILAGLLALAKVPWLVAALSLSMILAYSKKWGDAFFVGGVALCIFSLFIIYGIYFDRELFFSLWGLQLARYDLTFIGLHSLFTKPLIVDRSFLDGWIYFGFFAIVLLAQEFKKHIFILFPFLAYFMVFIFAIPDEPGHGWYRYPFYPFFIISTALFIKEYLAKNYLLTFLFLAIVGLSLFQLTWAVEFGFSHSVLRITILVLCITLLPLFFRASFVKRWSTNLSYVFCILLIVLNIWAVFLYNEQ